ncbi:CapA family protein [Merismopedia glauca]|nr:CapA family protein [Merismopedia glauca]
MKRTKTISLSILILGAIAACTNTALESKPQKSSVEIKSTPSASPTPVVKKILLPPEPTTPVIAVNIFKEPNQSNPKDALKPVPLFGGNTNEFLDIRGVGDSAMAETHQQPIKATFGQRLQQFDPTGKSYKGDLSFLNWETTVGTRCNRFWAALGPASFAFISHPDNLIQAYQKGFNLIGLANNHARDCPQGDNKANGALVSSQHLEKLTQTIGGGWLWHGVGTQKLARVKTFNI